MEINLLLDNDLDAVVGGMKNQDQVPKPSSPGGYVHFNGPGAGPADFVRAGLLGATAVAVVASL